jgi:hypothetical protein
MHPTINGSYTSRACAGSSGGNFTRPNTDIRALEPLIDVTPDQLRAQQRPWGYQGRSEGYGQPRNERPYGRPQ